MFVRIRINREVTPEEAKVLSTFAQVCSSDKGDEFKISTEPLDGLYKNPTLNPPTLVRVTPILPASTHVRKPRRTWTEMVKDAFKDTMNAYPSFSEQISSLELYLDWSINEKLNWEAYTIEDVCNLVISDDTVMMDKVVRRILLNIGRPVARDAVGYFLPPSLDKVASRRIEEAKARELVNTRQTGNPHLGVEEDISKKLELVIRCLNPDARDRYPMTFSKFLSLVDVHPINRSTALMCSQLMKAVWGFSPQKTPYRDEKTNCYLYLFPPMQDASKMAGWPAPQNKEDK